MLFKGSASFNFERACNFLIAIITKLSSLCLEAIKNDSQVVPS